MPAIDESTTTASREVAASRRSPPSSGGLLLTTASLWEREMRRFLKQPSRIVGLVAAPLLFWFFLGSGLGDSFRPQDSSLGNSLQYLFPGTVVMIVLFASVFSNMSTIEDRREGFLLAVLAAPIPRTGLVLGKILGGTTQALVPGLAFLLLAPLAGFQLGIAPVLEGALALFLIALSLTSLGFVIAWWMDSVQGFHAVLNLILMPAWVLSGALFPPSGASGWMRAIMTANPMTYEVEALRTVLLAGGSGSFRETLTPHGPLLFTALFAAATVLVALIGSGRPSVKHLG